MTNVLHKYTDPLYYAFIIYLHKILKCRASLERIEKKRNPTDYTLKWKLWIFNNAVKLVEYHNFFCLALSKTLLLTLAHEWEMSSMQGDKKNKKLCIFFNILIPYMHIFYVIYCWEDPTKVEMSQTCKTSIIYLNYKFCKINILRAMDFEKH